MNRLRPRISNPAVEALGFLALVVGAAGLFGIFAGLVVLGVGLILAANA